MASLVRLAYHLFTRESNTVWLRTFSIVKSLYVQPHVGHRLKTQNFPEPQIR